MFKGIKVFILIFCNLLTPLYRKLYTVHYSLCYGFAKMIIVSQKILSVNITLSQHSANVYKSPHPLELI